MGSGRILGVIGAIVVAAVAAGLWLALDGGDDAVSPESSSPPAKTDNAAQPADGDGGTRSGRKRTRIAGTSRVIGVVKLRKGSAAARGQTLTLAREGGEPATATTDDDGAFRFGELGEGGPYELSVAAPGCATIRIPGIQVGKDTEHDVGTLWLDLAAKAVVTVVDTTDTPVPGALVEAFPVTPWQQIDWSDPAKVAAQAAAVPVPVASATTDAAGRVTFPELSSGTWNFGASKAGLSRESAPGIRLAGGTEDTTIRVVLRPAHLLKGRVIDGDGRGVAGTLVVASRNMNMWDLSAPRQRATTDTEGAFRFDTLSAGDWALSSGLPQTTPAHVATVRVPAVKEIELRLKAGGRLTGTVTHAADGKAAEGVIVRAITYGSGSSPVQATTDAAGKFAIDPLPGEQIGTFTIEKAGFMLVRDPGRNRSMQFVPKGETVDVALKIAEGGSVGGVVTGPDGPVASARVQVYQWDQNVGNTGTKTATTDAQGAWSVTGVEKGRAVVQVTKTGLYQKDFPEQGWWQALQMQGEVPSRIDVVPGTPTKVDVRMEVGLTVSGRVEGPDGPVEGAIVTSGGVTADPTAADGAFKLVGLRPGAQTWLMPQKQGLVALKMEQISLSADTPPAEVVLKLVKQPVVRGKVVSASGAPLVDARVTPVFRGGGDNQMGWNPGQDLDAGGEFVRSDGSYEVRLTPATGRFIVRGLAQDHAAAESQIITVTPDVSEYEMNLTLEAGSTITGRVVSGGAGIAGARVSASRRAESSGRGGMAMPMMGGGNTGAVIVAISGSDGMFSIEHAAAGRWSVSAALDGYVAANGDATVPETAPLTLTLAPELTIEGSVLFADGTPVAGATISPEKDGAPDPRGGFRGGMMGGAGTQTTADGRFRIRALSAGQYKIRVDGTWGSQINLKPKVSDAVAAGATDVKIIVDRGLVISGRVVDQQKVPIANCWINANPDQPQQGGNISQPPNTQSKEDGSFELVGLGDGTYTIWVNANAMGGASRYKTAQRTKLTGGTTGLEIVLEEGLAIDGILVDEAGKPVPQVMLQAMQVMEEGQDPSTMTWAQPVTTGADGKFRLGGLGAGRFTVAAAGWNPNGKTVIVTGGESVAAGTTGLRLTTSAGLAISGIVVDETGTPIANVRVSAQVRGQQFGPQQQATTDAGGKFEITGLIPGKAYVSAYAAGRVQASQSDVAVGTTGLRLEMAKGLRASGRATRGGKPLSRITLMFVAADGKGRSAAATDDDGKFTIEGLAPGTWKIQAYIQKENGSSEVKDAGTLNAGDENVDVRVE